MPRSPAGQVRHRSVTGDVVPITAYVDPALRLAVQVAARAEGVSQSLFIQSAVLGVLSGRYEPAQMKTRRARENREAANA